MSSVLFLFATSLAFSSIIDQNSTVRAAEEASQAAEEAAIAAEKAVEDWENRSPEEKEAEKFAAIEEVDAAMRLIEDDPSLGEKIPIPRSIDDYILEAALQHDSAWINGQASSEKVKPFINIAYATGSLLYHESICRTGRVATVADSFIHLIEENFAAYPRRLLTKKALDHRDTLNDLETGRCTAKYLEIWRNGFNEALSGVN